MASIVFGMMFDPTSKGKLLFRSFLFGVSLQSLNVEYTYSDGKVVDLGNPVLNYLTNVGVKFITPILAYALGATKSCGAMIGIAYMAILLSITQLLFRVAKLR